MISAQQPSSVESPSGVFFPAASPLGGGDRRLTGFEVCFRHFPLSGLCPDCAEEHRDGGS
jgi:hypothetical protein